MSAPVDGPAFPGAYAAQRDGYAKPEVHYVPGMTAGFAAAPEGFVSDKAAIACAVKWTDMGIAALEAPREAPEAKPEPVVDPPTPWKAPK